MATDKDILTAMLERMDSLSTSLRVAWPGVNFDPGNDDEWLEVSLFPNEPDSLHWSGETQVFQGFLQVSVYFRPGAGIFSATDEAEGVIAHFPKDTQLGPVKVSRRPFLRPAVTDPDNGFLFIPVTIPYAGLS